MTNIKIKLARERTLIETREFEIDEEVWKKHYDIDPSALEGHELAVMITLLRQAGVIADTNVQQLYVTPPVNIEVLADGEEILRTQTKYKSDSLFEMNESLWDRHGKKYTDHLEPDGFTW